MSHRAVGPPRRQVGRALALLLASALAAALWVLLVLVAVSSGRQARAGGGMSDWVRTLAVSLVAAGVMLAVVSLLPRAWEAWQGRSTTPQRARRRRA